MKHRVMWSDIIPRNQVQYQMIVKHFKQLNLITPTVAQPAPRGILEPFACNFQAFGLLQCPPVLVGRILSETRGSLCLNSAVFEHSSVADRARTHRAVWGTAVSMKAAFQSEGSVVGKNRECYPKGSRGVLTQVWQ